jgi:hypothetical protein
MPQPTSPTPYLFLRIIAAVGISRQPMTVADLAKELRTAPEIIGQCIALHLYAERKRTTEVPLPFPSDFWVPESSTRITSRMLRPRSAGRILAVEAAIRDAMGTQ